MEDIDHGVPGEDGEKPCNVKLEYNDEECPIVELENGIDIRELVSEKGTDFAVKVPDQDIDLDDGWDVGDDDEDAEDKPTETSAEPAEVIEMMNSAVNVSTAKKPEEESPFKLIAKTMIDITEDGSRKVLKKLVRPGVGPVVPERSIVRVYYTGRLEYSEQPYDSSYLQSHKRPRSFKLGDGTLIGGMELAISSMRKDEICLVLIHPDYNMGRLGCPPRVPPNATALFRIHLESFSDRTGVHDYYDLKMSERKTAPMDTILQIVRIEKDEGKKFFKNRRYRPALNKYKKAINILEECHLQDEADEKRQQETLIILYRNAAACSNKLCEANKTIMYANSAIRINPKDVKAWFFKGKGLLRQSEFDRAKDAFLKAKRLDSNNTEITFALKQLDEKFKQFSMMETATYKRMFAGLNAVSKKTEPEAEPEADPVDKPVVEKENAPPKPNTSDEILKASFQKVSPEFQEHAITQMQKFKDNPDMTVLPFPSSRLTIGEIACLVQAAEDIGLGVNEVGTGTNHHYRFCKRTSPPP